MRRGCIALGDSQCQGCQRKISDSERYLAITEEDGVEIEEGGELTYYCVDCALDKGYASYKEEKDETILTFF
jgi:hypothetical protein